MARGGLVQDVTFLPLDFPGTEPRLPVRLLERDDLEQVEAILPWATDKTGQAGQGHVPVAVAGEGGKKAGCSDRFCRRLPLGTVISNRILTLDVDTLMGADQPYTLIP